MSKPLQLGDRVTILGTVEKMSGKELRGNDIRWGCVRYRDTGVPGFTGYAQKKDGTEEWGETFTPHTEGRIMGVRNYTSMENDEGIWIPDGVQVFTAYLVAWHMRRKPVIVREDQMVRVDG